MKIKSIYILFLLAFSLLSACSSGNPQQITGRSLEDKKYLLSVEEFEQKILKSSNIQLVDIREPEELKYGYISGALNIDYHSPDFESRLDSLLDKAKPVLVYCMSGGRSEKAAQIIRKLGFAEVYDLNGGIDAWEKAGKKIAK